MNKRKLIIHAGMRKTGSSAIQDYLFSELDDPRVGFFSTGMPNASLMVTHAFKHNFEKMPQFRSAAMGPEQVEATRTRAREQFSRVADRCDKPTTILSAEVISSFSLPELRDLKRFAREHFSHFEVIIYIRAPHNRAESVFQERLKHGLALLTEPVPSNFVSMGNSFDAVFGRENVMFRPFSPGGFPGGSVVADFLGAVGVAYDELPRKSVNSSLSLPAIQLLYVYRQFYPDYHVADKALVQRLFEVPGERFRMHPDLLAEVVRVNPASRAWLESRVGIKPEAEQGGREGAIRDDSGLLALSAAAVSWLEEQSRVRGSPAPAPGDLKRVARLLRTLAGAEEGLGARLRSWLRG
ncbi:hypothetical protein [Haliea sp. E17]|uniref:hypothetical protein n=1 Tax=Haliea sp. E17 TaxID=3401576 RepID=UPI003AADAD22